MINFILDLYEKLAEKIGELTRKLNPSQNLDRYNKFESRLSYDYITTTELRELLTKDPSVLNKQICKITKKDKFLDLYIVPQHILYELIYYSNQAIIDPKTKTYGE